ncbi:MAG: ABC transporter substrate-binding protein [Actinomycetota bacterium]
MLRRSAALVVAVSLFAACGGTPASGPSPAASPSPAFPRTFVDDDGVTVTLPAPPERIVTFAPSITEIVFAIGAGDRLVGVSGPYDDVPAEATALPEVGGAGEFGVDPNLEAVVALEPDLFLTIRGGDAWKDRLRDLGVPVVTVDATDLDDLLADIATIGALVGADTAAADLVDAMASRIAELEATAATSPRRTCFFEVYYPPLMTAGPGTFIDDLLERAGCDSVSAGAATAYPEWSIEDVVAASPDVYLVSSESAADLAAVAERAGFDAIAAVAGGRVVRIDSDLVTRPGPRIVDGLAALVAALAGDPAA